MGIEYRSLSAAMSSTAAKVKSLAHHSHNSSSHQPSSHRSKTLAVAAAGNSTTSPTAPVGISVAAASSGAAPQALLLAIMLTTLLVALVLAFVMRKRGPHTKISTKEDSLPAAEDQDDEHMPPSPAENNVSAARMNRS